jgi:hypothetical protein
MTAMGNEKILAKPVPKKTAPLDDTVGRRSLLLAAVAILLASCVTLGIAVTRGRFVELFTEFEIDVPSVTLIVLSPAFPIGLTALIALTIIKELIPSLGPIANAWNVGLVLLTLVVMVAYVISIFDPLMSMIEALS